MRNLKKLLAVVVAVALVLTSMTAAFAATNPQAEVIAALKLMQGNNGDMMLEDDLARDQAVKIIITLTGKAAEVDALTAADVDAALAGFADAAEAKASWSAKWYAYAIKNGIIQGYTNADGEKVTDFAGKLYGKQFATMLMKAFGFKDVNYATSVTELSELDGSKVVDEKADDSLTRADAIAYLFGSLTAKNADGKTVVETYVGKDADLLKVAQDAKLIEVAAPAAVAVDSVKSLNAKQIEVKFNVDMNADSVKDINFYEVTSNGTSKTLTSGAVTISDAKTVVITLNNTVSDKMTNSAKAKVKIKKDIKAVSGLKLAADVEKEFDVADGIIPAMTKVEATGEKTIKVTFSEPIYDGTTNNSVNLNNSNFAVKSGTYTYYVQSAVLSGNTVTLTLGTNLIEGPITVTANASGVDVGGALQDYAGYKVFKSEATFTYAKDTSVSVVTVKEIKQNTVKLGFSKPVKATNLVVYHSVKGGSAYVSNTATFGLSDEYTFTFANEIPAGTVKLFIVNSTVSGEEMVDGYGVKVPDQTLTAERVVDVTGPVVSSSEVKTNVAFEIVFDEDLNATEATKTSNYTFKSVSDNKDVYFTATYASKKVTLTPSSALADQTQYQVVVKNVKDVAGNNMAKEATLTFTTGDNTAPTVSTDTYAVNADGKIYLVFSEPMNEAAMLDKANYSVATNGAISSYRLLGDNDTVTKISNKSVLIDLNEAVSGPNLKIASSVTDLAGKKLGGSIDVVTVSNIAQETVLVSSAQQTATNKIKVTFNKELTSFDNTELAVNVTVAGVATTTAVKVQGIESQSVVDGKTVVVFIVDQTLNTNATYGTAESNITIVTDAITANTKSVSGTVLQAGQAVVVADKLAPTVAKADFGDVKDVYNVVSSFTAGNVAKNTTGTITITFSENIKVDTISTLTFKVDGYSVTAATATTSKTVVLTVKATADPATGKPSVTQVYDITDTNGNSFAAGTVWQSR